MWAGLASEAVVAAIPGAERRTVEGQDHAVAEQAITPLIVDFLGNPVDWRRK